MKKVYVPQAKVAVLAYFSLYNEQTNRIINVVHKEDDAKLSCQTLDEVQGVLDKAGLEYIPFTNDEIAYECEIIDDAT